MFDNKALWCNAKIKSITACEDHFWHWHVSLWSLFYFIYFLDFKAKKKKEKKKAISIKWTREMCMCLSFSGYFWCFLKQNVQNALGLFCLWIPSGSQNQYIFGLFHSAFIININLSVKVPTVLCVYKWFFASIANANLFMWDKICAPAGNISSLLLGVCAPALTDRNFSQDQACLYFTHIHEMQLSRKAASLLKVCVPTHLSESVQRRSRICQKCVCPLFFKESAFNHYGGKRIRGAGDEWFSINMSAYSINTLKTLQQNKNFL